MASTDQCVCPSPFQLALASIILKNKPLDVSAREYISTFLAHLKRSAAPPPYQQEVYLDGVQYWRLRCQRLDEEKTALQAQIVDLQYKNNELHTKQTGSCETVTHMMKFAPIRDQSSQAGELHSEQRQREESASLTGFAATATVEARLLSRDITQVATSESLLGVLLYRIHESLNSAPLPDVTHLANDIMSACEHLSSVVESARGSFDDDRTSQIVLPVHRALTTLLYTCRKFDTEASESHRKARAAAVYAVTSFFNTLLDTITADSFHHATLESTARRPSREANPESQQSASLTSRLIANLICAILDGDTLSSSSSTHRAIYEGLAFLVIRRTSLCLSVLVHGRETDDAGQSIAVIDGVSEEIEQVAFEREALYIGQLIEHVTNLSSSYLSPLHSLKTQRARAMKSKTHTAHDTTNATNGCEIHESIRDKLQTTLIGCMLKDKEGEHDEFWAGLRKPVKPTLVAQKKMPKGEERARHESPANWFVEKVWSTIGWQILNREE